LREMNTMGLLIFMALMLAIGLSNHLNCIGRRGVHQEELVKSTHPNYWMDKSFAPCNNNHCSLISPSLLKLTQCPESGATYIGQVWKIKNNRACRQGCAILQKLLVGSGIEPSGGSYNDNSLWYGVADLQHLHLRDWVRMHFAGEYINVECHDSDELAINLYFLPR